MNTKEHKVPKAQDGKSTWKTILNFIIEILKLIIAAFFGAGAANNFLN